MGGRRRKPITQLKNQRAIFNRLKSKKYWKRPTQRVIVASRKDADRIGRALSHFAGGHEVKKVRGGYSVGSKGYYHYIGA